MISLELTFAEAVNGTTKVSQFLNRQSNIRENRVAQLVKGHVHHLGQNHKNVELVRVQDFPP